MVSRSTTLLRLSLSVLIAGGMLAFNGCAKPKAKDEFRSPRLVKSNMTENSGDLANANAISPGLWSPDGNVPGAGDGFGGGGIGMPDETSAFEIPMDGTGSIMNTAPTDGVEDGTFLADLEMIHFEFDSDVITPEWQSILESHCRWLNQNPNVMVQVEGHCDERGTDEYNISLGQRRADSVREFMVDYGIDPNRLSTISYGEMRPLTFESTTEAHALNRRAMFLVYEVQGGEGTGVDVASVGF